MVSHSRAAILSRGRLYYALREKVISYARPVNARPKHKQSLPSLTISCDQLMVHSPPQHRTPDQLLAPILVEILLQRLHVCYHKMVTNNWIVICDHTIIWIRLWSVDAKVTTKSGYCYVFFQARPLSLGRHRKEAENFPGRRLYLISAHNWFYLANCWLPTQTALKMKAPYNLKMPRATPQLCSGLVVIPVQ